MTTPIKTVASFVQSLLMEQSPRLTAPDGRPIYGYRVEGERYQDLLNRVRSDFSDLLCSNPPTHLAAGFVLYAAETWRRADDVSRWNTWHVVLGPLGRNDVHAPDLYAAVRKGLAWWQRPLRTLGSKNRYIATLVCEGGLPMHLVGEKGTSFRRYFRDIVAYIRDFGLTQLPLPLVAEKLAATLPKSLQQEPVYGLASDLVESLWHMHQKLAGREGNPIQLLDEIDRTWRDHLPLRLDDQTASSLLSALLTDVSEVVANRGALPNVRRWIEEHNDGWQIRARVQTPSSSSIDRFAGLFGGDADRVPSHFQMAVITESSAHAPFGTGFNNQSRVQLDVASSKRCEVQGKDAWGRIDLNVDASDVRWGHAEVIALPKGQHLSASQPWVFRTANGDAIEASLLADGGCRTRLAEVFVTLPPGVTATPETDCNWREVGALRDCERKIYLCSGRALLTDADGGTWLVATSQSEERQLDYYLGGERFDDANETDREIYRGAPRVMLRSEEGEAIPYEGHDRVWRPAGRGATWSSGWAEARGMVDLRVRADGETRLSRRVGVLPANFTCTVEAEDARRGFVRLRGIDNATIIVKSVDGLTIERQSVESSSGIDLRCVAESAPPASLDVRLEWPGTTPLDLILPAPFRSGHFITPNGSNLTKGYVALDDLFSIRIQVVTPEIRANYEVVGQLRDRRGTAGVSLSEANRKIDLRLPLRQIGRGCFGGELRHLVDPVRRAMRAAPELDLQVELRLQNGGTQLASPRLEVQRYAGTISCEWEHGWVEMATKSPALEAENAAIGIRAFPLWLPQTRALELDSLPTDKPTWLFDPSIREPGPWLLYGHVNGHACTRPRLWVVDKDKDNLPEAANAHQRAVLFRDKEQQATARAELYAKLCADEDQAAWDDLYALIDYSTHLPASSFDTVRMLVENPTVLLLGLLSAPSPELRRAVFDLREELGFDWARLPLASWQEATRCATESFRSKCHEAGLSADEVNQLIRNRFDLLLAGIPANEPALQLLFTWAFSVQITDLDCPTDIKAACEPRLRQPILEGLKELWLETRRRQTHNLAWPAFHGIDSWTLPSGQAPRVPRWEDDIDMPFHRSIARAPWVAACSTLADIAPDPLLTLELMRARAFDAEWFDKAHERYLALAIATFLEANATN